MPYVGRQYQADAALLEAEQGLQVAWRNLFLRVGQGTVQVEDKQVVFLCHLVVSLLNFSGKDTERREQRQITRAGFFCLIEDFISFF